MGGVGHAARAVNDGKGESGGSVDKTRETGILASRFEADIRPQWPTPSNIERADSRLVGWAPPPPVEPHWLTRRERESTRSYSC